MYKVYAQEQVILFTNERILDPRDQILHCKGGDKMEAVYQAFLQSDQHYLNIFSEEIEQIWDDFMALHHILPAAGGLVKNKEGAWLLIFRNGKWDLPKGKVEEGEAINLAALREVEEECGIGQLKIEKALQNTFHVYELKGQKILKPTYWFKMSSADENALVPQIEEGITAARWMNWQEINDIVFKNTYPLIKEVIVTGLGEYDR